MTALVSDFERLAAGTLALAASSMPGSRPENGGMDGIADAGTNCRSR